MRSAMMITMKLRTRLSPLPSNPAPEPELTSLAAIELELRSIDSERAKLKAALEALPDGGARLVCMSNYGAAQIRSKLKAHIMKDDVRRERFRPLRPLW